MNCFDAGDSNDDGQVDIGDAITVLDVLFSGGDPPPAPGPNDCGIDPTADALDCESYNSCGNQRSTKIPGREVYLVW